MQFSSHRVANGSYDDTTSTDHHRKGKQNIRFYDKIGPTISSGKNPVTLTIERIEILLLIAAVVAMLARRLRVPYSIGLVVAGIGLAMIPMAPYIQLTKE